MKNDYQKNYFWICPDEFGNKKYHYHLNLISQIYGSQTYLQVGKVLLFLQLAVLDIEQNDLL